MNGRLLTIDQVAEYMGVHRDTVYALVRSGRLPALQLGGRKAGWRITEADLDEFVAKSKAVTASGLSQSNEAAIAEFDRAQSTEMQNFQDALREKRREFVERRPDGQ